MTQTFALSGLAERPEDIPPNLEYELTHYAAREQARVTFSREALSRECSPRLHLVGLIAVLSEARRGDCEWFDGMLPAMAPRWSWLALVTLLACERAPRGETTACDAALGRACAPACDATLGRACEPATCDGERRPARGAPPPTRRDEIVEELHGVPVADPYRWLEDADDPAVMAWAEAQDAHARDALRRLDEVEDFRRDLKSRLRGEGVVGPVRKRAGRYFYGRMLKGRDRAVFFVREGDGPERVLLDPEALDPDGRLAVQAIFPSPDGRRVAYRVSRANADRAHLRVREVDTGREDPRDVIRGARWAAPQWLPDSRSFIYVGTPDDPSIPPPRLSAHAQVLRHTVGTPVARDLTLRGPTGDPRTILLPRLSGDGRWLVVHVAHGSAGPLDIYVRDLEGPAEFTPVIVGASSRTEAVPYRGQLYLRTSDGADRYRIVRVDPRRPARADWVEIVPQREWTLDHVGLMAGHLVLVYLEHGNARVEVFGLQSGASWTVPLPRQGAVTGLWGHPDADEVLLVHSSLAQRPQIYRVPLPQVGVATAAAARWEATAPDPEAGPLTLREEFVTDVDGTPVPVFILHRSDLKLDGARPTVLTGYGGFGLSIPPAYSAVADAWVQRGGVWALGLLRGGGEYGEAWHRAGMRERKRRVFNDLINIAERLVLDGYTVPERLGIMGGSNGGLLVGAASTTRPDLFGAVVCRVPLLDMIRYHRFGVAPFWIDEYGSSEDRQQFLSLLQYSPYHRVRPGVAYPPLLMMSADSDDRVDPLHARKYVAAMQAASPGSPALLRVERNAGHQGSPSREQNIEAAADMLGFLRHELAPRRAAG